MLEYNPTQRNPQFFEAPYPSTVDKLKRFAYDMGFFAISVADKQRGADSSKWNTINDAVAMREQSGIQFAYLKLSQGNYLPIDPVVKEQATKYHQAGIFMGGYHFFDPAIPGAEQALYYLEQRKFLEDLTGGILLHDANDVEWRNNATNTAIKNRSQAWLDTVESNTGRDAVGYTSPYLQTLLTPAMPKIGWGAHWTSALEPVIPSGWTKDMMKLWQYGIFNKHSWVGVVAGVSGELDVNWFFGTYDDLKNFANFIEVPPPPVDCCEDLLAEVVKINARIDGIIAQNYGDQIADLWVELNDVALELSNVNTKSNQNKVDIGIIVGDLRIAEGKVSALRDLILEVKGVINKYV